MHHRFSPYHKLLSLLETPQEGRQGANIHGVREDGHKVVQDSGDLAKQGADELGSLGDLDVEQLLDSQREALFVGHHGDVVEAVEVGQGLQVGLVLDQLLGAAVKQSDVGVGSDNLLSTQFENESQDTVGGGMLGTEVDRVVADLALLNGALARLLVGATILALDMLDAVGVGEAVVDGHNGGSVGGSLAGPAEDGLGKGSY